MYCRKTDPSYLGNSKPVFKPFIHDGVAYWNQPQRDALSLGPSPLQFTFGSERAGYCNKHKNADRSKQKQARHEGGTQDLEFEAYLPHPEIFLGAVRHGQLHTSFEDYEQRHRRVDDVADDSDSTIGRGFAFSAESDSEPTEYRSDVPDEFEENENERGWRARPSLESQVRSEKAWQTPIHSTSRAPFDFNYVRILVDLIVAFLCEAVAA
jgi:hypothetical protein